jgi:CDP-glucose 4,6-dehydratase
VRLATRSWGDGLRWSVDAAPQPYETKLLKLDCTKASDAGWKPLLDAGQAVEWTMEWYRAWRDKLDVKTLAHTQIERYSRLIEGGNII